jgi:hypothetical protein
MRLLAACLGLALGSGTALLGTGGEVEVGSHDVGDAPGRAAKLRWIVWRWFATAGRLVGSGHGVGNGREAGGEEEKGTI